MRPPTPKFITSATKSPQKVTAQKTIIPMDAIDGTLRALKTDDGEGYITDV